VEVDLSVIPFLPDATCIFIVGPCGAEVKGLEGAPRLFTLICLGVTLRGLRELRSVRQLQTNTLQPELCEMLGLEYLDLSGADDVCIDDLPVCVTALKVDTMCESESTAEQPPYVSVRQLTVLIDGVEALPWHQLRVDTLICVAEQAMSLHTLAINHCNAREVVLRVEQGVLMALDLLDVQGTPHLTSISTELCGVLRIDRAILRCTALTHLELCSVALKVCVINE
jgi:hypothetical protein